MNTQTLENLPEDMIYHICNFLSLKDIVNLTEINNFKKLQNHLLISKNVLILPVDSIYIPNLYIDTNHYSTHEIKREDLERGSVACVDNRITKLVIRANNVKNLIFYSNIITLEISYISSYNMNIIFPKNNNLKLIIFKSCKLTNNLLRNICCEDSSDISRELVIEINSCDMYELSLNNLKNISKLIIKNTNILSINNIYNIQELILNDKNICFHKIINILPNISRLHCHFCNKECLNYINEYFTSDQEFFHKFGIQLDKIDTDSFVYIDGYKYIKIIHCYSKNYDDGIYDKYIGEFVYGLRKRFYYLY